MITGESIPVEKDAGDPVIGVIINQRGLLHVRATNVEADTVLASIIRLVEQAQGAKAPIQRVADTISSIFVPVVLVIAVVTFLGWAIVGSIAGTHAAGVAGAMSPWIIAIVAAVAVLMAAYPCALGLATPTAVMVGMGKGAEQGNLKSLATALALSRATLHTIKQNLFWAFAYTIILIPTAMLPPLIPFLRENAPIFAAAAMALSSVTIVSNSLRLRRFGR